MTETRMRKKQVLLDSYVRVLRTHFDSVRVFVTSHDAEGDVTYSLDSGSGNFNSQKGQIRDWCEMEKAKMARFGWDKAYKGFEGGK